MKRNVKNIIAAIAGAVAVMGLVACGDKGAVITPTPVLTATEAPKASATPTEAVATPTDAPVETPEASPTEVPTEAPTPTPEISLDAFQPIDFFKDAVYCGDSLMNFYQWRGSQYLHPKEFGKYSAKDWLVLNSYAVRYAVADSFSTFEPKYNGETVKLWDAIPKIGKTRVIMFFGPNDIGVTGVDKFVENYDNLIKKIQATGFKAKYYILSVTPMREDCQTEKGLNNKKIAEANQKLQELCEKNGYYYIDVASKLCDANNNLILDYSDGTNVHITSAGYVFWDEAMIQFAKEQLREEFTSLDY